MEPKEQKRYSDEEIAAYVDKIMERLTEFGHWSTAEEALRQCPKGMLPGVAFLLLRHIVIDTDGQHHYGGRH